MNHKRIISELQSIINGVRDMAQKQIDKFTKSIEENGVSYSLIWYGQSAMNGEELLSQTDDMKNLIEIFKEKGEIDLGEVKRVANNQREYFINKLTKGCFEPNSTCPMRNLEAIQSAKAHGDVIYMLNMITSVVKRYEEKVEK